MVIRCSTMPRRGSLLDVQRKNVYCQDPTEFLVDRVRVRATD